MEWIKRENEKALLRFTAQQSSLNILKLNFNLANLYLNNLNQWKFIKSSERTTRKAQIKSNTIYT